MARTRPISAAAGTLAVLGLTAGCLAEDDPPPEASEPPQSPSTSPEPVEDTLEQQGVSAGHPMAVAAGEQILSEGGNAVDAAIAASFAVAVVEPYASGIGGGGSAILAGQEGDPVFYDYREVVNEEGEIPDSGAGIPGFVAGMGELHENHGTMDWSQLLEPAETLASEGFEVSDYLAERMAQDDALAAISDLEHYAPGGEPLGSGEQLVQEDLGETLSALAENGWEDFYTGQLAESVAEQVEGVDQQSLENYEVAVAEPSRGEFGDYELLAAAPSLPGPAMIQMMQIAEAQGIAEMDPTSAEYVDLLSESWLVAEETVFSDLGDPSFIEVPEGITDAESNAEIDLSAAEPAAQDYGGDPGDHANTTHISVVDSDGLTVSMTNTIMYFWGSGQMVDGYFVNNHLSRFEAIDSPANEPEPGRRTVTWSNPTVVLDAEQRPVLAAGSPGGHQILNILGTVLAQWGLQGRTLEEAIATPRFRAEEDTLYIEESTPAELVEELEDSGWQTEVWPDAMASFGSVQPLEIDYDDGTVSGADDPRREGAHAIIE
ncbi:gamma-glutamyltransferase [Nesterenkonia lacusekhoensis]|uniref:Gamma-glutamyltranspeptidase/glutathione hydrolase n=1 Tax=Nesterenkonia lacusekhoensis TaxID=150832 RepID=A0ABS4T104_9MICC|nr:gamma-glutamyltransferase [Nesterenkonia lacusekhoensis]MBP2318134.1 gamma-glutamyltranspeptidase/glutathione hydrolase [Nesterenkonia lacusekhoensis]